MELGPLEDFVGSTVPADTFWETWLTSPTVRRFERGECDDAEFGRRLHSEFGFDIEPEEIIERFSRFPRGLFTGAAELVGSVRDGVATGVLSNTNRLHWEHQSDGEVIRDLFDHRFLSYELGLVKPDEAMFRAVIGELGCEPEAVLFVDDNLLNVEGARSIGIDAHLAVGVEAARAVLDDRGLLRA